MRIAASKTKANLVFFMVAVLLEKRILRLHISRHRHLITRSNRTKIAGSLPQIFDRSDANFELASVAREVTTSAMFVASGTMTSSSSAQIPVGTNAVEGYKASMAGNGLHILDFLQLIIERGAAALTPAEKELLMWIGVFFRKPTPGKFIRRIRRPTGFASSTHLRTIAALSRRLGNTIMNRP